MQLSSILHDLGLSDSKAEVYLASLANGPGTAQDIASQVNIPRTTAHEILTQLTLFGIINFTTHGRTRIYAAEPPKKLLTILKEKERRLETAMPELMALYNTKGERPSVRIYPGLEGIKTVFEDTLTVHNKLLLGILSMEDLYKIPGKEYMDSYVARRVAAGIQLNVIRSEQKEVESTWTSSHEEHREAHFAQPGMIFPMTLYIYDNKVGIIGTQKENFGMIIESADFFLTQKNLFDTLWQVTRVLKRID